MERSDALLLGGGIRSYNSITFYPWNVEPYIGNAFNTFTEFEMKTRKEEKKFNFLESKTYQFLSDDICNQDRVDKGLTKHVLQMNSRS